METWMRQPKYDNRVNFMEITYIRGIVGISKFDRTRNELMKAELKQEPTLDTVENKQLSSYACIWRMLNSGLVKKGI